MKRVLRAIAISDQVRHRTLPLITSDVALEHSKYFGNRLDPQNRQSVIVIKFALLADIRTDMDDSLCARQNQQVGTVSQAKLRVAKHLADRITHFEVRAMFPEAGWPDRRRSPHSRVAVRSLHSIE